MKDEQQQMEVIHTVMVVEPMVVVVMMGKLMVRVLEAEVF
jgi:hypothetical protein